MMTVSVCIIAYNEEKVIDSILDDIVNQTYDHGKMEVVLVNNDSTDATEQKMNAFAAQDHGFLRVTVEHNDKKSQASGWNRAIMASNEEVIIRIDAHASVPPDFVEKNIECQEQGEYVTGGPRPNILVGPTPWKQTLLLAESSMFGSSIAGYRRDQGRKYVNSMFHAAYRREVFDKAGLFNENLGRTEDNEMHYRIRKAGYQLCFDPQIHSYQYVRSSFAKMLSQKFANGYWIGLTTGVCPQCLSLYHFVPFAFVLAIIITTVLSVITAVFHAPAVLTTLVLGVTRLMWNAYWLLAVLMAAMSIATAKNEQRNFSNILLPVLFFSLHVSYGIGTIKGLVKMPSFVKGIK